MGLGKIIKDVAGAVGGPIVSGGLDLMGDVFTQSSARSAYKSRYQDEVADLRKAGLNPALAYGANPGNPNTATFSGLGQAAMSGAATAQQIKQSKANQDLTQSQADLLKAQTADLVQQVRLRNANLAADTGLKGAQATSATAQAELSKFQKQRGLRLLPGEAQLLQADLGLRGAQTASTTEQAKMTKFLTHRAQQLFPHQLNTARAAGRIAGLSVPQAQAIADWFRNHHDLGGWTNSAAGLANLLRSLTTITSEP